MCPGYIWEIFTELNVFDIKIARLLDPRKEEKNVRRWF
jgi:hypothetical protein